MDYTISYYNNTEAGIAIAVITRTGNYTGEVARSFRIVATGIEEPASAVLRIAPAAGGLLISSLTPGENFKHLHPAGGGK
ncbi:MAG: hypothetical protein MdMp024_0134 [Bacteroidales bacterium]